MAINFPTNPEIGDAFTAAGTTWKYDGSAWYVFSTSTVPNSYTIFGGDAGGTTSPSTPGDLITITGAEGLQTTVSQDNIEISLTGGAGGGAGDVFKTVTSNDGTTVASGVDATLSILGGTNITTAIATDTSVVEINMENFGIDFLSDVDTASNPPTTGNVLKWDGSKWAPGADIASGGAGLDADTLDGFDSAYYLNYNNLNNTPSVLTLGSLSIGNEPSAEGNGAITYDNTTGVFRYTPPDLSSFITSVAFSDLTSTPNTLSGYGIIDAFDGAFSSLTGKPTTIAGYGITDAYTANQSLDTTSFPEFRNTTITDTGGGDPGLTIADQITQSSSTSLSIERLGNAFGDLIRASVAGQGTKFRVAASGQIVAGGITYPITDGTAGQVLTTDGAGNLSFTTVTGGGSSSNAFSNIAVSGQDTVSADTTTDTLTVGAGTGISITTNSATDTITISSTVSSGATVFNDLTDVSTAGLDVDKIYEPAIVMYRVQASGTSAYLFDPHYPGNNPTLYVLSGTTIAFDLSNIPSHPFAIQDSTGTNYNTGLVHVATDGTVSTGSNAQSKSSGTLYWRIPEAIGSPPNYRYQCTSHSNMVGPITIKRFSSL